MTILRNIQSKAYTYYMYPILYVLQEPLSWSVFKFNLVFINTTEKCIYVNNNKEKNVISGEVLIW